MASGSFKNRFKHSVVVRIFQEFYLIAVAVRKLPPAAFLRYVYYKSGLPGSWNTAIPVGEGINLHLRKNRSDVKIFEQIFLFDDCAVDLPNFCPHTIIDGGAHIGCVTAYWLLRYPGARVIAVEAEETNYRQLQLNVGSLPNVRVVHGAISDQHGWAAIENPGVEAWGFHVVDGKKEEGAFQKVPRVTIADLVEMTEGRSVDLLKLDIEGSELDVFRADTAWLDAVSVITVELHDRMVPGCREAFEKAIAGYPAQIQQTRHNVIWIKQKPR